MPLCGGRALCLPVPGLGPANSLLHAHTNMDAYGAGEAASYAVGVVASGGEDVPETAAAAGRGKERHQRDTVTGAATSFTSTVPSLSGAVLELVLT